MFSPLFSGTLGSGISQTLSQQSLQQGILDQFLGNVERNIGVQGQLDLLTQFADQRSQGLSPNQSLFNVSQNSLNPATSLNAFGQFAGLTQAQTPFALGAATQGNTSLLNQIGAPTGLPSQQGALPLANLLPQAAALGNASAQGQVVQQQQNAESQAQVAQIIAQLAQVGSQSAIGNAQRQNAVTQNAIQQLSNRRSDLGLGDLGNFNAPSVDINSSTFFPSTTSSTGTNGFSSTFRF